MRTFQQTSECESSSEQLYLEFAAECSLELFDLSCPSAPGVSLKGAIFDISNINTDLPYSKIESATGAGGNEAAATASCIGEAIETAFLYANPLSKRKTDLTLESNACWRFSASDPVPSSAGCAAGSTSTKSKCHGLLELVERNAVEHWWKKGRRPNCSRNNHHAAQEMLQLRDARQYEKHTTFLDVTTDLMVPVVAAVSWEGEGSRMACGFAAGLNLSNAIKKAFLELCQMETAQELAVARMITMGQSMLSKQDLRLLQLAQADGWHKHPLTNPEEQNSGQLELGPMLTSHRELVAHVSQRGCMPMFAQLGVESQTAIQVWRTVCDFPNDADGEVTADWCVDVDII